MTGTARSCPEAVVASRTSRLRVAYAVVSGEAADLALSARDNRRIRDKENLFFA